MRSKNATYTDIKENERADCCGLTRMQSEQDGFDLVRVGAIIVCGECLVEAGAVPDLAEA